MTRGPSLPQDTMAANVLQMGRAQSLATGAAAAAGEHGWVFTCTAKHPVTFPFDSESARCSVVSNSLRHHGL